MPKAVFTTRVNPTYDDLPEARYHFPQTYLNQVKESVGDWIVYYEPRRQDSDPTGREGRQAYFAAARVTEIRPDPNLRGHFYAYVSDYLEFDRAVAFRENAHYYESALKKADGSTNRGAFGRAVRLVPDEEYDLILGAGFSHVLEQAPESRASPGLHEDPDEFERPVVEQIVRRPIRDAAFSRVVRAAYESSCAMTGIKLINGGGRSEIDAAHIRPIGDGHNGPDSIRNGMALCKTVHWMFDRGLVSLTDECELLIAKNKVPQNVRGLFNANGRLNVPSEPSFRPHKQYLAYHRQKIFIGS